MKRNSTKKKGKGLSDIQKELAKIEILLKARAQKNEDFYSSQKEKQILEKANLEKEKFGQDTRAVELLKNREKKLLEQVRNNPNALIGNNLKKEMANLRRAKTNAIKANPLVEPQKSPKKSPKKPAKKPANKTAKKEKKPKK